MQIFVSTNGSQEGPFSLEEINDRLGRGELRLGATSAWIDGQSDWVPLAELPGLSPTRPAANVTPSNSYLVVMPNSTFPLWRRLTGKLIPATLPAKAVWALAVAGVVILALAGLVAWASLAAPAGGKWITFLSPGGDFSVAVPRTPVHQSAPVKLPIGTVLQQVWSTQADGEVALAVQTADYPRGLINPAKEKTLLDGARDGAVSSARAVLQSEAEVVHDNVAGREIHMRSDDGKYTLVTQIFLVGDRMYMTITSAPRENDPRARRFLDSLRFY